MSSFEGMEDLLQDFLVEAGDLLSGVDNKLVDLEQRPGDHQLLNEIFRGFHTIKGGAGFLNATELVTLCHLTENLFDKLRNSQLSLSPEIMDVILSATAGVRHMFDRLGQRMQPDPADPALLASLKAALAGQAVPTPAPAVQSAVVAPAAPAVGPDWNALLAAVTGAPSLEAAAAGIATVAAVAPAPTPEQAVAAADRKSVV